MKRTRIRHAVEALAQAPSPQPSPDAAAFWAGFRAHARYRPQHEAVARTPLALTPRWVAAAASLLILLSAAGVYTRRATAPGAPATQVNSLEVIASHGGVLILEDEPSRGTIVWIMDMEKGGA